MSDSSKIDDTLCRMREGRAFMPKKKADFMERLLGAWLDAPHLRFGQLIENVFHQKWSQIERPQGTRIEEAMTHDMVYLEDEAFVDMVEKWVADRRRG
jgi:hypothetical protein